MCIIQKQQKLLTNVRDNVTIANIPTFLCMMINIIANSLFYLCYVMWCKGGATPSLDIHTADKLGGNRTYDLRNATCMITIMTFIKGTGLSFEISHCQTDLTA